MKVPRDIDLNRLMGIPTVYSKDTHQSSDSVALTHPDTALDATICSYHYHSKVLPTKRFVCYRLCDLKNDEMQQIIHSNDGKETECSVSLIKYNTHTKCTFRECRFAKFTSFKILCAHVISFIGIVIIQEDNGWCSPGTYEKLRALANKFMLARAKEINIIT